MWIALLIVLALIGTQIAEGASGKDIVHLWPASLLAAALMLLTRCMNASQVRCRRAGRPDAQDNASPVCPKSASPYPARPFFLKRRRAAPG
jgi:hypothetical protein